MSIESRYFIAQPTNSFDASSLVLDASGNASASLLFPAYSELEPLVPPSVGLEANPDFAAMATISSSTLNNEMTHYAAAADQNTSGSSAATNMASLGIGLSPSLTVNAANPSDVKFVVSGLSSDYSGTVTFTDTTGKSDVVPIRSNGTYVANLSSLADGTLTYVMTVSNPAGNVITMDPTVTLGDGSANAPSGAAQLPNLLSGYAMRPSWMVAGVDYAVGAPSGITLTDWENLSGPGILVNKSTHVVTIENMSGVNISDVDFSLHGGATLMFVNSPNAVVSNCIFGGSNLTTISNAVIAADQGSGGLTVEYCTIDGAGAGSGSTLVSAGGSGAVTLEYNWFKNFPQHVLELTQGSGTSFSVVYKYNLIEQGAEQPGAHLNYLQFNSGTATSVNVEFNTSYQTPQASGGEGYQFYDNSAGGSISNITLAYNTMIASGGAAGTAMSYLIHGSGTSGGAAYSNYISDPAAWGVFYNGSVSGWSLSNNVDMTTGNVIQGNNSEIAPSGPAVASVFETPSAGALNTGKTVTLTLNMSEVVAVVGGTPTLSLNDGGVATYTGGSGSSALAFSYTVAPGQNTSDLAATAVNLNGAIINDGAGNSANLSISGLTQTGPEIDTSAPSAPSNLAANAVSSSQISLSWTPATDNLGVTKYEIFRNGTLVGTSTTNSYNDTGLSASTQYTYTVEAYDPAGNASAQSTSASATTEGIWSNFSFPTQTSNFSASFDAAPSQAGEDVVIGLAPSAAAAYTDLAAIVRFNSNGTIDVRNGSAYGADVSVPYSAGTTYHFVMVVNPTTQTYSVYVTPEGGTQIALATNYAFRTEQATDTSLSDFAEFATQGSASVTNFSITPTSVSLVQSPSSGDLNTGKTVTFTLKMSEAVTVTGGTPTLTLNDGGTAAYTGGSGTALTFSYTVAAGQNTASLAATALNQNSATITDAGGNVANLSLTGLTQNGPQIDTTPPAPPEIVSDQVIGNLIILTGTAENNSTVRIYEGANLIGTTTTNANGAWAFVTGPQSDGAHVFAATASDAAGNVSAPSSPYDPDVGAGPTITAAVISVGNQVYVYNSAGSGLSLSLSGSPVTVGEFSGWTPIAAAETASGYDVAWENTATGQYTVWATDSNGNYLSNIIGVVAGNSYALESIEPTFNQDLNGDGTIGLTTTLVHADGSTNLTEVANQFYLYNGSGTGPALQYNGADVVPGEFYGWTPIGAVQTASGYDVAWQNTVTGQYTVWSTDSNGNYTGNVFGAVAGTSSALEALEPVFDQNLNGDGQLTTTVKQTDGSTSLTAVSDQVATVYYLANTNGSDPALQYNGADVTAGEFAGWTPIGAVQTATGYDVAWQNTDGQYTVWSTNSSGQYTGNVIGAVSANSTALEQLEPVFGQDLNGDGTTGLTTTVIKTDGSTSLTQVANQYDLDNSGTGTGPALQYSGADVTTGEFAGWTPIGAVQTASGYDVAWQNTDGQYTVWSTNSSGQYTGNVIGAVSANSTALEQLEPVFGQDLNGDGTTGLTTTVIKTDGSTSLTQVANQYDLDNSGTGTGPALQYSGADVTTGEFAGWTPIGAVQTASGYDVAWQNTDGQYTVWSTNSSGQYTGNVIGAVSANSTALEQLEPVFGQDLNGDGVVGLYAAPATTLQISSALSGATGAATIGAGATLALAGADSAAVTFAASTGELVLSNPSTFTGEISGFTGNGTLAGSDQIDLKGLSDSGLTDSYSNGVLTLTSGGQTDKLDFNGSYVLANFSFASDGSGGTIVYDPPVASSNPANRALISPSADQDPGTSQQQIGLPSDENGQGLHMDVFSEPPTLGYATAPTLSAGANSHPDNLALFGSYIASSFPTGSGSSPAVPSAAWENAHQSLLADPHHG